MSEISRTQRQYQDELTDLQAEHNRRKKRMQSDQKQELADLRETFQEQKADIQENNAAAVNHIVETGNKSIAHAQDERRNLQEKSTREMNKIEDVYRKRMQEMRDNRQQIIDEQDHKVEAKLNRQNEKNEERINNLRRENEKTYNTIKERGEKDQTKLQQRQEEQLTKASAQNAERIDHEQERGRIQEAKLHEANDKHAGVLKKTADEDFARRESLHARRMEHLDKEQATEYDKTKKNWQRKEETLNTDYTRRLGETKEAQNENLKTQNKRFDSLYTKNEKANKQALQIQKTMADRELNELKRQFLRDSNRYMGKAEDPFYKVQNRGSDMQETRYNYVIHAYVPDHEKDAIHVTVDKNKAVVHGQRSFQDRLEDADGKKVSSSSYQTFREEFAFEKPIIPEAMTRERQGDWIQIVVPKLNTYSKKA